MKKLFLSVTFVVMSLVLYGTTINIQPGITLDQNTFSYVIHFSMPDFEEVEDTIIAEGNEYIYSRIRPYGNDAFDYLDEDGRPSLPFCALDLILPSMASSCQVSSVQINNTTTITLNHDYTPAQSHAEQDDILSYDTNYYGSYDNTWYWQDYQMEEYTRGIYRGLTFSFFPCHYEPSQRELEIITDVVFEITWEDHGLDSYLSFLSEDDRQAYVYFDNFLTLPNEILLIPPIDGDGYLIIYADRWSGESSLWEFVSHKENLGYNVFTASLSETGYTPDEIRTYIKEIFDVPENKLKYVLLVGDVSELPFSMGDDGNDDNPPTDVYYASLDENSISNQDWDITPDIYIGRWPVTTNNQLFNIVEKTISQDINLGNYSPNRVAIFTGSGNYEDSFYKDGKYIYDYVICDFGYYSGVLFDGRTLSSSAPYILENELEGHNGGYTWMFVYTGHGLSSQLGEPYFIGTSNISNIVTSTLPYQSFGFGFACELGNIFETYNFCRSWIGLSEGGVTFMGATTSTYVWPDRYLSRKMFNQLENKPIMTIGEFVANGKDKYFNACRIHNRFRQAKKYVLYGDPSLYLYGLDFDNHTPHAKPYRDILDSEVSKQTGEIVNMSIYTQLGQLLFSGESENIHIQELPSGTYVVVIQTAENKSIQKLIIK